MIRVHPHNPGYSLYSKASQLEINFTRSHNSPLPCNIIHLQVPGVRMWAFWGATISPAPREVLKGKGLCGHVAVGEASPRRGWQVCPAGAEGLRGGGV